MLGLFMLPYLGVRYGVEGKDFVKDASEAVVRRLCVAWVVCCMGCVLHGLCVQGDTCVMVILV